MSEINLKEHVLELIARMSEKIDNLQDSVRDILEIANFASIPKEDSELLALYCKNIQIKINDYG